MDNKVLERIEETLDIYLTWDDNIYGEVWREFKDEKLIFLDDYISDYVVRCIPKERALYVPFKIYGFTLTIRNRNE